MFDLIYLELLKTKRSLALLMMLLSPLAVVIVNLMLFFHSDGELVAEKGWAVFWAINYSMWGYFMLPLYIALITALLNGIEHKVGGWRLMLSLPVTQWSLFLAKAILAWIYILGASFILFLMILLSIVGLNAMGYEGEGMFNFEFSAKLGYSLFACVAILIIQHIVSWRWTNIVAPLALGVIATMSIVQASSSKFWKYDPWTYILMATNASSETNRVWAIGLSLALAALILACAKLWIDKREITC